MDIRSVIVSLFATLAVSAGAGTLYVDDDWLGKGGTGVEAAPYGTIQDAVNAAKSGDTILVLPGTYDQGCGVDEVDNVACTNRVLVTGDRNLTIRSTGGKAVTTIKGAFDKDDPIQAGSGVGPAAIRAICVQQSSNCKLIVEGFTITESAVFAQTTNARGYGGAVYAFAQNQLYLIDCEIKGCTGSRGLTYRATLVRCSVHDNTCIDGKGSVNYNGKVFNSVAVRNVGDPAFDAATVVNTTLAGCSDKALSESCLAVNCLMTGYGSYFANYTADSTISNCVVGSVYWSSSRPTTISPASANNVTNAVITQCAAPFEGDFRPVAWSDAIGVGDAGLLASFQASLPGGIDLYRDFHGKAIPMTGAINAGAVQDTVTPKGGAVLFKNAIRFVGDTMNQPVNYYRHAIDSYPQQWHVTPALGDGQYVLRYLLTGLAVERRCPLLDDSLWLMPPPAGTVCTGTVEKTSNAFWVDPETGSDEPVAGETRGTESAPFKTLQKAADVCMTKGSELSAVVFAAAGTYAEGGASAYGAGNRLYCSRPVRFIGQGIGKSIIKGELDLSSDDHGPDGRGANAKRCVALAGGFVQGFTLTDGRCAWLQGDTGKKNDTCGGCAFLTSSASINDCLVTNGIAERGSAAYGDKCFRTRIVDCPGGIYNGGCYACVVIQNPDDTATGTGNASGAYFCTGLGTASSAAFGSGSGIAARYCIADGGNSLGSDAKNGWRGNVVWNYVKRNTTEGYQYADPCFVDKAHGDYRVTTASPAFTCATLDDETWKYYTADIDGRPLLFTPEGNPVAGAFQNPVAAVSVADTTGRGVTITNPGVSTVAPGESLTVTVADGERHVHGLIVDGEKIGEMTYTYTAPAAGSYENHLVTVVPDYSTDWYVNANTDPSAGIVGSDANDGFTPETPMLTFTNAMAHVVEGDTIHAAAGVYAEGYAKFPAISERKENRARLYINTPRITVVADEGRDVTFIEGADAETSPNTYGLGDDATRAVCVEAVAGVRIKGFTLRKGRTYSAGNDSGGGASCANGSMAYADRTVFEDCCFTNNWGFFGGAIKQGVCVNCTFFCNNCTQNRGVSHGTDMYGCFFDWNKGSSQQGAVYGASHIVNCTFGPHHTTSDNGAGSTVAAAIGSPNAGSEVRNCVILCKNFARIGGTTGCSTTIYNCAFSNEVTEADDVVIRGTEPIYVSADCVDAAGRPVKDSVLVDGGDNVVLEKNAPYIGETALDGGQRVYNATIDIGALEYDWRADYAAAIGGGVAVTNATPGVQLADGKVQLVDGAAIAGVWPCGDVERNSRYTVTEKASDGTLTGAFLSGGVVLSRTVTDATKTETFKAKVSSLDWAYSFAASDEDGCGEIGPFGYAPPPGTLLIVR